MLPFVATDQPTTRPALSMYAASLRGSVDEREPRSCTAPVCQRKAVWLFESVLMYPTTWLKSLMQLAWLSASSGIKGWITPEVLEMNACGVKSGASVINAPTTMLD